MDANAEQRLGEEVIEKVLVQSRGTGRSMVFFGLIGMLLSQGRSHGTGTLVGYKGQMFLLLGPTRIGFFRLHQGLLRASVGEPLGILRRDSVTIDLGSGALTTAFTVHIADGTTVELEVPRVQRGKLARVAGMLASAAVAPPAVPTTQPPTAH